MIYKLSNKHLVLSWIEGISRPAKYWGPSTKERKKKKKEKQRGKRKGKRAYLGSLGDLVLGWECGSVGGASQVWSWYFAWYFLG